MSNTNTKQTVMKAGVAVSAAAVAGILINKKGEALNTEEIEAIVKVIEDINADSSSIEKEFCYGKRGDKVASFSENKTTGSTILDGKDIGTAKSVSATVIKNDEGKIIGYYYQNPPVEGQDPTYTVHYNGQTYRNATMTPGPNGNTLSGVPDGAPGGTSAQAILTVDPTSNSVSANGKVIGTATPPPSNGSTNFVVYETNTTPPHVTGFVETTTGQGFFEGNIGHGTQRDSVAQVKNLYLATINKKVTDGELDPKIAEELKQYIKNIEDSSVKTHTEFNNLLKDKISDMKNASNFEKGYEAVCNAFNNSSVVKEINDFVGADIVSAEVIVTMAIVGGLVALGATLANNKDSIKKGAKKLVLSSPSSLSSKSSSNTRSK